MGVLAATVLVVLLGSGLCSGSEAALLSVSEIRARQLAEDGSRRGRALLAIKQRIGRPLAAIVVLNNVFNIVGSITVGAVAAAVLGQAWVGVVSAILTFLVILFSEILPKTLAERHAEQVSLWVALPIRGLTALLTPLVVLFELLMRPVTRGPRPPTTSEREIRLLAHIGRREGLIEADEAEMIQRVFQLNDLAAKELMTPRTGVSWLDADKPVAAVKAEILAAPHSRIVVAEGDLDRVVGIALKHELLTALLEGTGTAVRDHVRPVEAVPWLLRADDLLERFHRLRARLLLVLDEHGGTMGVVTLEDVLGVLAGEFPDEADPQVQERDRRARRRRRHD
jgi:CBS domain containing-hemolysin-like protein